MTEQNRITKHLTNGNGSSKEDKIKRLRKKVSKSLRGLTGNDFHQTPWMYYKFLSIEQAAVLSALTNLAYKKSKWTKARYGIHFLEKDGKEWFWCNVRYLCRELNISGKVEHRLLKQLSEIGVIEKFTKRPSNRRYIHIATDVIHKMWDKAEEL